MRYESETGMSERLDRALKCALHEDVKPDDALHRKVLYSWKEERAMKGRKYKAAVAAVVAAIAGISVISGGVYAAVTGSGILESFKNRGNQMSKDAEKLVDREPQIEVAENEKELQYIDYTVDEVVCDDYTIYARVTVKPKDADKYFLLSDSFVKKNLDDSVSILHMKGVTEGTVGEYANGRKIIRVSCGMTYHSPTSTAGQQSEWVEFGENGELYCYSSIQDTPGLDIYTEKICIHEYEGFENNENGSEIVTVTVDNKSSVKSKKEYKTVDDKLDYGIELSKISAITTELGTYITIEHTPMIEYAPGDWGYITPYIFDEDGNEIEELGGHGKDDGGKCIMQLNYGSLDMSKISIGFRRMYDANHDVIDESVIGPYAIEEVR